jgi:hypothetical protein
VVEEHVRIGKVESNSIAADRLGMVLSKCTIGLGTLESAHPGGSRKETRVFFAKVAAVEFFPGCETINQDGAIDTSERSQHCLLGGYHLHHACRNFIGRYAPYLPTIVVLKKLRLVTCSNITEADFCWLSSTRSN